MSTWTIPSKKQTGNNRRHQTVWIYANGFCVESLELEIFQYSERDIFIKSIKENKLPEALLKSLNYPGDDVDYHFEDRSKETGTSLAWRNYESQEIELKEYDPEWSNLYQEEYKTIVSSLPMTEYGSKDRPLMLEMEHIGSTSIEGMCAKPIIDMLIVQGHYRNECDLEKLLDKLINMGYKYKHGQSWGPFGDQNILIKKGFIIHFFRCFHDKEIEDSNYFIIFREYLRTHPDARDTYNKYKKSLIAHNPHMTIKEYASQKDWFVNNLLQKAVEWYRQHKNYVHIGDFNDVKKQWTCCNTLKDETATVYEGPISSIADHTGCCQPGLKKDSYHPGRYYATEYDFVRGWWKCCFQGRHTNGCVKVRLLTNGDVLLRDCEKWGINSVSRWVKSLSDINKDYSDNFREQGINGHLLLTLVDDAVLQDMGISTLLHRKIFLKAIDELKGSP